ncbi:MAG: DUF805 domain-containing protein [Elusimicrobiaceae bacterium]|nr:DUF805 domain-containing protein [Elusimicrobiaceae bacterium]
MEFLRTYYIDVIKNHYIDLSGRATRKQYWLFFLVNFCLSLVLSLLGNIDGFIGTLFWLVYVLYCLALILPSLGIAARRLHDAGFSAWWLLLILLPFLGPIVLLVFYVLPSTGPNRFDK